jgi:GNAT superfamily N-acetyltransferase
VTLVGAVVRDATAGDAEAVLRMVADLAREVEDPPPRLSTAAFLRDMVGPERCAHALVAEQDGRLVGYAVLHQGYNTVLGGPVTHLVDLFVAPAARRQGIGRELMRAVARRTLELGGRELIWDVWKRNDRAYAFYERLAARHRTGLTIMSLDEGGLSRLAEAGSASTPHSTAGR